MNVKKIIIILLLTSPIISHGIPNFMIDRIKRDLSYFVNIGITQDALEKTVKKDYFFVRCQIINQKIKPVYATFFDFNKAIFPKLFFPPANIIIVPTFADSKTSRSLNSIIE